MNSYGTFTFYKSNGIGHTEFWRYAQTNMNVISHKGFLLDESKACPRPYTMGRPNKNTTKE